jgi:triphosphatase
MSSVIEQELKLTPDEPELLDRIWSHDQLGPFLVLGRRTEQQRNSFYDTRTRALGAHRLALRRRCVPGQTIATWTLKGEGEMLRGIATRPEIELHLREDTAPVLALGALTQAARERGAAPLAEEVEDAMRGSPPPLAQPFLELVTERRLLDLTDAHAVELEVALDQVRLEGHPTHAEDEVEVELRRGDAAALEVARAAIAQLGGVREGQGSKLSRALDHLRACGGC